MVVTSSSEHSRSVTVPLPLTIPTCYGSHVGDYYPCHSGYEAYSTAEGASPMSVRRQLIPGLFVFVVVGSLVWLPGTATAAPAVPNAPVNPAATAYPPPAPTVSVSTTTPTVGSSLGMSYHGFRAFERVSVDLVPGSKHLGTLRTNAGGNGFGSVRIPGGLRGTQVLLLTGLGSARVATAVLDILGPGTPQGGGAGGGTSGGTGAGGSSSGNAGRAGEGGAGGGISGSQSAGGSAGLASTGFSAFEYARIAGGLILAGGALALVGRRVRRRSRAKAV